MYIYILKSSIITGFYNFSIIFQVFVNNIHINISYFFVLHLNILLFINEPLRFSGDISIQPTFIFLQTIPLPIFGHCDREE